MGANKTVTSFLEIPKQKVYKPMVRFYKLVFYKKFYAFKNSCIPWRDNHLRRYFERSFHGGLGNPSTFNQADFTC